MGEVFLATAGGIEGAERPCVVKIIRREHAADRSFLARFLDEARIQSQLVHPGVAQIQEASTDPTGKPYVVLEYVEGRNLGEVRHRATQLGTRIAWSEAVAIGVALTEALAHVHECTDAAGRPLEIVHRDLSPQNVMIGYGGEVKVIDFGTARGENRRCHTVAGVVFAKPGYVAPEVANNTPGAAPADLYAVGIMLWELISGRRFLTGEASEHMAAVAAGERRPTPLAEEVGAPHELDAVVAKLTAHKISGRYGSAREAMTDLVALLKRAPTAPDGERSVRARVAKLIRRLYPAEPARSRAEFGRLVAGARHLRPDVPGPVTQAPALVAEGDSALLPGTRYRLVRKLGHGAMGTVYEAEHVDLGRRVAIKALTAPGGGSPEAAERFRSEARAIAQLRHENLVTVFDFGVAADGRPFYVMEYLDGEALDERMAREPRLDWTTALSLGVQACRALEAAHGAGVVHRDIKPSNLLVARDGTLKLLDFGIALLSAHATVEDGSAEALAVFGTPEYMAPEQGGGAADVRSDVYALGAVLYELLTGTLPHDGEGAVALLDAKRSKEPEPAGRRAPKRGIPRMLEQTIQKALAREPDARFQSAADLRDALEAALREPQLTRQRRRRLTVAVGAVGVATVMGLVGFAASQPSAFATARAHAQPLLAWFGVDASPPAAGAAVAAVATPPRDSGVVGSSGEAALAGAEELTEPTAELAAPEDAEEGEGAQEFADLEEDDVGEGESAALDDTAAPDTAAPDTAAPVELPAPEQLAAAPLEADPLASEVAAAVELIDAGRAVKAHWQLQRMDRKHPDDPRVLAALARASAATQRWGDAYRAAWRWMKVDPNPASRLELARMARAVGKRDEAVATLRSLLRDHPENAEAQELLGRISPAAALAMRDPR